VRGVRAWQWRQRRRLLHCCALPAAAAKRGATSRHGGLFSFQGGDEESLVSRGPRGTAADSACHSRWRLPERCGRRCSRCSPATAALLHRRAVLRPACWPEAGAVWRMSHPGACHRWRQPAPGAPAAHPGLLPMRPPAPSGRWAARPPPSPPTARRAAPQMIKGFDKAVAGLAVGGTRMVGGPRPLAAWHNQHPGAGAAPSGLCPYLGCPCPLHLQLRAPTYPPTASPRTHPPHTHHHHTTTRPAPPTQSPKHPPTARSASSPRTPTASWTRRACSSSPPARRPRGWSRACRWAPAGLWGRTLLLSVRLWLQAASAPEGLGWRACLPCPKGALGAAQASGRACAGWARAAALRRHCSGDADVPGAAGAGRPLSGCTSGHTCARPWAASAAPMTPPPPYPPNPTQTHPMHTQQ
jgi:hypothetical protein